MWLSEPVGRGSHGWWTATESPPRQHNAHTDQSTIQLRLVHVTDGTLCIRWLRVQHVRDPPIRHEVLVHRHLQILNVAICAEDLAKVGGIDVLGELFNDDLGAARRVGRTGS